MEVHSTAFNSNNQQDHFNDAETARRVCIVCGAEFEGRADKKACSKKCGIKHQHNKRNEPTLRDRITDLLVGMISPQDDNLYSDDTDTHLFDESELDRDPVDEWTEESLERLWPGKLHL
jgi:predicted nucleic acid-binding Zn ribbon protein